MITIISSIIGFVGGFIPDILRYFKQKQDNAHELSVLQLQIQAQERLHVQKLEEINTQADISESAALYKAAEIKETGVKWADALLGIYNGTVRPTITYAFMGLYVFVKIGQYVQMVKTPGIPWEKAIMLLWSEFDQAALLLTLSYYFGQRMSAKVFKLK